MTVKVFNNFLPEKHAEFLEQEIFNTPEERWSYAFRMLQDTSPQYIKNTLADRVKFKQLTKDMEESMEKGLYTYRFKRSVLHPSDCYCYLCTFTEKYLNSENFIQFIRENSDVENPYLFERFASVYDRGDLLTLHKDQDRGVAFIFNFTRDWRPEYGGLLHVIQPDGTYKAYIPEFNSLFLIQLNKAQGTYHFVSEVSSYAPKPRIAISGWYNDR